MEIGNVLNMASALQGQRVQQAHMENTISNLKEYQSMQASLVAQLLASIPSVNPDGVGGVVDVTG